MNVFINMTLHYTEQFWLSSLLDGRCSSESCSCSVVSLLTVQGCSVALLPPGGWNLHGSAWPYSTQPSEQRRCADIDPSRLISRQITRSGWTPSHHSQGGGVWWRSLIWGVLQWGGVLWRRQHAVRGPVLLFLLFHLGSACIMNQTMKYSLLDVLRYQTSDTEYETPKGYHHPDAYYDDDEQPLYHDSRRSPKRRLLPATPQGE